MSAACSSLIPRYYLAISSTFTVFIFSPIFRMSNKIIQYAAFASRLLRLDNTHIKIAHFFLVLDNIFLSRWTAVSFSIHRLKDILIDYNFWQLRIKHSQKHICAGFFLDIRCLVLVLYFIFWLGLTYPRLTLNSCVARGDSCLHAFSPPVLRL